MRYTKIVATVGPASSGPEAIRALVAAGVDVFRVNFSHGTHASHGEVMTLIRAAAREAHREVAILQDLSGPKIRTGRIRGGGPLMLNEGDRLEIRIGDELGSDGVVSTTYAPLATSVRPGDRLLLDDGKIALVVEEASEHVIVTHVANGGPLGEHKGINAPNVPLPAVAITAKDEADLRFGLAAGVDMIAISFVQRADDIARARAVAAEAGRATLPVVAKLERPEAIAHLREIVQAADAVMLARGDLGLEMPLEQVPQVQKLVLRTAREQGVPVIVATQVLESMRTEPLPTRAEVSDAAGAVDGGADAIMLSGETAVGAYPVRAVETLDAIIRNAEAVPPVWTLPAPAGERPDHTPPLCDAAVTLVERAHADAILAVTRKGRTARLLAARRPRAPIYALTPSEARARELCLWWGVCPLHEPHVDELSKTIPRVISRLRSLGRLPAPATVVIVSGDPNLERADANFVRIRRM